MIDVDEVATGILMVGSIALVTGACIALQCIGRAHWYTTPLVALAGYCASEVACRDVVAFVEQDAVDELERAATREREILEWMAY